MNQEGTRAPYSVSELTDEIRQKLESNYAWVQVRGEISNFKKAPSGHAYFRLKDENALLSCVAWRSTVARWAGLDLQDGVEVLAGGHITVYPPRGQYQLVVTSLRMAGIGLLQQQFEALKRRLAEEGYFDPEHKKPLPRFPQHIALITSSTGAAVRDFLNRLNQGKCPLEVTLCPVLVQGDRASAEIAAMIKRVNRMKNAFDLIVLCRGGGSLEDLWAFNEETAVKAIYDSHLPVLTGVGHEIDFTLADFTADLRASTPTGAAQVICTLFDEHRQRHEVAQSRLLRSILPTLRQWRERLELTQTALKRYHPIVVIQQQRQRLDEQQMRLIERMQSALEKRRRTVKEDSKQLTQRMQQSISEQRKDLLRYKHLLHSYNPSKNLERGFAICRDEKGKPITTIHKIHKGDSPWVQLADGSFHSKVISIKHEL